MNEGSYLDLLEEITSVALEILIKKRDMLSSICVKIAVADWLRLHLAEAIEIQLRLEIDIVRRLTSSASSEGATKCKFLPVSQNLRTCYDRSIGG